jgi:hypothetical protein
VLKGSSTIPAAASEPVHHPIALQRTSLSPSCAPGHCLNPSRSVSESLAFCRGGRRAVAGERNDPAPDPGAQLRTKIKHPVQLVRAFLILPLAPHFERLKFWLLTTWCHRNEKWSRETPTPLYRLRLALAQLWRAFPCFTLPC